MTRKPEHDQVSGLSNATRPKADGVISSKDSIGGDVMGALKLYDRMIDFIENVVTRHSGSWNINDFGSKSELKTIRNALIAQYAPISPRGEIGMVTIPRKVLEGMINYAEICTDYLFDAGYVGKSESLGLKCKAARQAINEVLNYKEGE
jgi:hypothetical protein